MPTGPVGIKRIMLMLAGVFGGLLAGLGAVYIAEHLNSSIKGSQKLRELGVTVLAEIPYIWSDIEEQLNKALHKPTHLL